MRKSGQFVVTGIGTDVGKTVVSAILAEVLRAHYWKPVQAGDLEFSDSKKVTQWTQHVHVLPERFRLSQPMSPHAAARLDGQIIDSVSFAIPQVSPLIVEGAGGVLVPLNDFGLTYADLFQQWNLPVIVVSKHYLGSINHTLMTVEVLKQRNIEIAGIVFVGDENKTSEEIILHQTGVPLIARVPWSSHVDADFVRGQAQRPEFLYAFAI